MLRLRTAKIKRVNSPSHRYLKRTFCQGLRSLLYLFLCPQLSRSLLEPVQRWVLELQFMDPQSEVSLVDPTITFLDQLALSSTSWSCILELMESQSFHGWPSLVVSWHSSFGQQNLNNTAPSFQIQFWKVSAQVSLSSLVLAKLEMHSVSPNSSRMKLQLETRKQPLSSTRLLPNLLDMFLNCLLEISLHFWSFSSLSSVWWSSSQEDHGSYQLPSSAASMVESWLPFSHSILRTPMHGLHAQSFWEMNIQTCRKVLASSISEPTWAMISRLMVSDLSLLEHSRSPS